MLNRLIDAAAKAIEHASFLDRPADALADAVQPVYSRPAVQQVASGSPIGHPLHPLLVTVPVGAWASSLVFDALGDDSAASTLIALGAASALPTAFTGMHDWSSTMGAERRVGFVHAGFNTLALTAYVGSLVARRRGRRGLGIILSLVGMAGVSGGGWLGGHLSYAMGVGVDTTAFQHAEEKWTDVAEPAEVVAGKLTAADLDGVPLVLTRVPERGVVAFADRCTHRGAPLHEGTISDGCIVCPWHGSAFSLRDGTVDQGPATRPQSEFEVRIQDGRVQARRLDERSLRTQPIGP